MTELLEVPPWVRRVAPTIADDTPDWFTRFAPPADAPRVSAVLILVGPDKRGGEDIILTERTQHLRSHAGQVSFPGGRLDPGEGPIEAALRESHEEVGLDPNGVEIVDTLPPLYLTPSSNAVHPVIGWWPDPHPVGVKSAFEVERVVRAHVTDLTDPANRFTVTAPGGYKGPGFEIDGLFVWGFTAQLLTVVLEAGGVAQPWDEGRRRRLPLKMLGPYLRRRGGAGRR